MDGLYEHQTLDGPVESSGGISAVPLTVAFASAGWGEPGTAAYRTYETLNRLTAFALLLMVPGWLGLFLALPRGYGRWGALAAKLLEEALCLCNPTFWKDLPFIT